MDFVTEYKEVFVTAIIVAVIVVAYLEQRKNKKE